MSNTLLSPDDDALRLRKASDWVLTGSSLDVQAQLDDMAKWYVLNHPEFVKVAQEKDPAIRDKDINFARGELCFYPGVKAIAAHEIAHQLYHDVKHKHSSRILARKLAEAAHSQTGIDIHPGTQIGENCFIDHGTGDVIGETAKIGNSTVIYQGVTLGAYRTAKNPGERHPIIGSNCTISSGVNVLGHVMVGDNVVIGPAAQLRGNHIVIGDNVKIGASAQIGENNIIDSGVWIGDGVVISAVKANGVNRITKEEVAKIAGDEKGRPIIPDYSQVSVVDGKLKITKLSKVADDVSQLGDMFSHLFNDVSKVFTYLHEDLPKLITGIMR